MSTLSLVFSQQIWKQGKSDFWGLSIGVYNTLNKQNTFSQKSSGIKSLLNQEFICCIGFWKSNFLWQRNLLDTALNRTFIHLFMALQSIEWFSKTFLHTTALFPVCSHTFISVLLIHLSQTESIVHWCEIDFTGTSHY